MASQVEIEKKIYSVEELVAASHNFTDTPYEDAVQFINDWQSDKEFWEVQTSGSTGTPKTISISRRQMIASAMATIAYFNWDEKDVFWLLINPKYIGGKMLIARALLTDANLIISKPKQDFQAIETLFQPTVASIVPLQIEGLREYADKGNPTLKNVLIGGAPMNNQQLEMAAKLPFPAFQTYGMTETVSHIALRKVGFDDTPYSVLPGIEIALDERDCLCIRGDVSAGEWVKTNDVVRLISENAFLPLYRIDDVINSGGVKIPLPEVENKLQEIWQLHSGFICIGLQHNRLGEELVVCFFERPNQSVHTLLQTAKQSLPSYWEPKRAFLLTNPPVTESGKLNRKGITPEMLIELT